MTPSLLESEHTPGATPDEVTITVAREDALALVLGPFQAALVGNHGSPKNVRQALADALAREGWWPGVPNPMTTPGRQAAIELAAKALHDGQLRTVLRPFERCDESTKAVYRNGAIAVIDAYERALAEQPQEER